MLKKLIIVSSAAAVVGMGFVGVASAHDHHGAGETTCTSNDVQKQSNKGDQLLGGNLAAQDAETNVLGAQATRPAGICPSIGNNNHL